VKFLLQAGADPNKRTEEISALIQAALRGNTETVRILLQAGADVSADGVSALIVAAAKGHLSTVRVLLEHGADVGTAMKRARERGQKDVADLLGREEDSIARPTSRQNQRLRML
jgi:ankyrin repeat protein